MGDDHEHDGRIVQLRFQPMWRYIDGIRDFCDFFTRTTFDDRRVGDRTGIVVHELVENAVRYSTRAQNAVLEVIVETREGEIQVVVMNHVEPTQIAQFQATLAKVNDGSARDVYLAAMERARSLPEDQSGLGLPRIRYEGRMSVDLSIVGPSTVRVLAKGTV